MNQKKAKSGLAEQPKVYRATTGLENADGVRVETGEPLPDGFVPDWQREYWLAQGDVAVTKPVEEETA